MLQKLEDFYLAILRFVVIMVAGVLLIAVIVLAVKSTDALSPAPEPAKATPSVSQIELKKAILDTAVDPRPESTASAETADDPDQVYYNRTAASIKNFIDAHFAGQYNIDPVRLSDYVKERADAYETAEVKAAYAKNLSENVDVLLVDKDLVAYARDNAPGPIIDRIVDSFTEEFDRQLKETETDNQAKQDAYLAEKAQAQQNLYLSAGAFGIFLLIVFLSIVIRIERNLRPQNRTTA